jgi:hypothetical protein
MTISSSSSSDHEDTIARTSHQHYEYDTMTDEAARYLAAADGATEEPLDYTVLSVGVTTLALLLCGE